MRRKRTNSKFWLISLCTIPWGQCFIFGYFIPSSHLQITNWFIFSSSNMKVAPGLPANYSCFRCGSSGHHIRNCPNNGVRRVSCVCVCASLCGVDHKCWWMCVWRQDKTTEAPLRIKKSTGIPRSFMVEVDDPSIKGAMLTNCGHYAIPAIHAWAKRSKNTKARNVSMQLEPRCSRAPAALLIDGCSQKPDWVSHCYYLPPKSLITMNNAPLCGSHLFNGSFLHLFQSSKPPK